MKTYLVLLRITKLNYLNPNSIPNYPTEQSEPTEDKIKTLQRLLVLFRTRNKNQKKERQDRRRKSKKLD